MPDDELLDYVPTQAVADFLATEVTVRVDTIAIKVDQQADEIDGVIERIDKLVIAIGDLIRSNRETRGS